MDILQFRFTVLRLFNVKLVNVLPLIDFSQGHLQWSLAHQLTKLKGIIFLQTKLPLFNKIVLNTTSTVRGQPHTRLNRPKALKAKESKFVSISIYIYLEIFNWVL